MRGNVCPSPKCKYFKKLFLLLLIVTLVILLLYSKLSWVFMEYQVYRPCNFENIDFFDQSLKKLFWKADQIKCDRWKAFVDYDDNGTLTKNDDVIRSYGYVPDYVNCQYSLISRKDKGEEFRLDFKQLPSFTPNDFCYVRCYHVGTSKKRMVVYQGLHYTIQKKITPTGRMLQDEGPDRPSIIIFLVDSVSRLIAENFLPDTMKYLRQNLSAYEMKGYTKIGDNSQPNYVALWTGKFQYEAALPPSRDFPWLFRQILNRGYIDCYADDWDPALPGYLFRLPEYTHYMMHSSYFHAAETQNTSQYVRDSAGNMFYRYPHYLCSGNKFVPHVLIDYIHKCVESYADKAKFALMWQNVIAHGLPNYLSFLDSEIKEVLERMQKNGRVKNTFLFVMSDHGPRYGEVLQNELVRRTGPSPLLAIVPPEDFKHRHPEAHKNLLENTNRLTSTFDVFQTLSDIVSLNFERNSLHQEYFSRGISLFKHIPKDRSCYDASIPESYCPCYTSSNVSTGGSVIKEVAKFLVNKINDMLDNLRDKCLPLSLSKIKYANKQYIPQESKSIKNSVRYVVAIETLPGPGLFEGTVERYNSSVIKLMGEINRLNAYGNQSHCIENIRNKALKLFCYCKL